MLGSRFGIILFACVATIVKCELFTSMAHLQTALYAERDIALALKDYISEEENRLAQLKSVAEDLESHSRSALESKSNELANPVNAYLYVKRFTLDWDSFVAPLLKRDTENEVHKKIADLKEYLPTYEDLNGAVAALLRLQDTYKLNTDDLARGLVGSTESNTMTASDCFELGKISYNDEDYYHTSLWMAGALKLLNEEKNKSVQRQQILDYLSFSSYKPHCYQALCPLPAHDCFEIGRQAYQKKDFFHCTKWMTEALDKDTGESNKTVARSIVLDYLAYSTLMQGNIRQALTLTDELLTIVPHHTRAQNNRKYYQKMLEEKEVKETRRGEDGSDDIEEENQHQHPPASEYKRSSEFQAYESLCRGENTRVYKDKHRLRCRYKTNGHPLLVLFPAREEDVYLDPWIVLYHNVVTDREIETIKKIATPRLNRATIQNPVTGKLEYAPYRVSKSAWLKKDDDAVINHVNNRIQAITGLDMDTAEDLQIANYGLGGHYEPHFDFARRKQKTSYEMKVGNRIATFLTYMTDVEAGGATVFPYIGVKLFPIKGTAAFWYNLYKNGDGIYDTRHAACPVLVGEKWVSNKWIHERGQEFRRRCGLSADE